MAIATWDAVISGMAASNALGHSKFYNKASLANAAAGTLMSLWRATGYPTQPAIPGAWATCVDSDTGSLITFTNPTAPAKSYLGRAEYQLATTGAPIIYDRLGHMGGLNGTLLTAQTVNGAIPTGRLSDPSSVEWFLEWYTDTGATVATATVSYTNQNDVSGRTCTVSLAATRRAGMLLPIVPTTAGDLIKSIQSVTLSASTGTAGSFGVTACRRLAAGYCSANNVIVYDAANLGLPEIPDDACLMLAIVPSTTSTGVAAGLVTLIQG